MKMINGEHIVSNIAKLVVEAKSIISDMLSDNCVDTINIKDKSVVPSKIDKTKKYTFEGVNTKELQMGTSFIKDEEGSVKVSHGGANFKKISVQGHDHDASYEPKNVNIQSHILNYSNPHSTNLSQVGLIKSYLENNEYDGLTLNGIAGEVLSKFDIIYPKNHNGTIKWFRYANNIEDKNIVIKSVAMSNAPNDTSFVMLRYGVFRNDNFGMINNSDESKLVYASDVLGGITLVKPSNIGNISQILGFVLEENIVFFNPSYSIEEIS